MTNLCNSCTNIGCEFQSGIVRTNCVFYIPPHIKPDNCGNYVVMQSTVEAKDQYEARLRADMVTILDNIKADIERYKSTIDRAISEDELKIEGMKEAYTDCLEIIDEYKAESEE